MIKYYCSDGSRVSEATIKAKLSKAYRTAYADWGFQYCRGCGGAAQGSAHIIPKSILKQLHLTELIWAPFMFIPACHNCNSIIESIKGEAFKKLLCYKQCLEVFKKYDQERYAKATL